MGRRMRGDESLRTAVERVVQAIEDEGPVPGWHRGVMMRQRLAWPLLWRELDRLQGVFHATENLPAAPDVRRLRPEEGERGVTPVARPRPASTSSAEPPQGCAGSSSGSVK